MILDKGPSHIVILSIDPCLTAFCWTRTTWFLQKSPWTIGPRG